MKPKDFEKYIAEFLKEIGFSKKKGVFAKKLNEDCYGTIGFMKANALSGSGLGVNPIIGVLNIKVEELSFKLDGYDALEYFQPTIFSPLGYLMPEKSYKEWVYNDLANYDAVSKDMIEKIKEYGIPFMIEFSGIQSMLEIVERGKYIHAKKREVRLPALYYLTQNKQKGIEFIEQAIEKQKNPDMSSAKRNFGNTQDIIIVGPGVGKVDEAYLKVQEIYKQLP